MSLYNEIVEVDILNEMRKRISYNVKFNAVNNSKTLVGNEGKAAGFAGEEIVKAYFPQLIKADSKNLFDYDFITPNGYTIDVKSKGNCKHKPYENFDCTLPLNQKNQKTDILVFTRISSDLTTGWIAGFISKKKFLNICTLRKAGDKYNNAGRHTVDDVLVCSIADLTPISKLKEYFEGK